MADSTTGPDSEAFLARLSRPARGALVHEGITTPRKLSVHSEKEILAIHGIGPRSIPTLREALAEAGLRFRGS
jgi:hypothetical protein